MMSSDAVTPCPLLPGRSIGAQYRDALGSEPFGSWLRQTGAVQAAVSRFVGRGRELEPQLSQVRRRILSIYATRIARGELKRKPLHSGATVWIAESDMLALALREFLQRSRTDAPRRPSLVSFDNTLDAFVHDIAGCSFNIPTLVKAMVLYVTSPRSLPARQGWAVTVPCTIMPRGSLCGWPPKEQACLRIRRSHGIM
jgi:hypothetical protein